MNPISLKDCLPANVEALGPMAVNLLQEYCKCPTAVELLSDVGRLFKSIGIEVGAFPTSYSQTSGLALVNTESLDPAYAAKLLQRTIDEQTLNVYIDKREQFKIGADDRNSRLQSLIFEFHNRLQKEVFNSLQIRAYKGNITSEDYARESEYAEWNTAFKTAGLLLQCQNIWQVPVAIDFALDFDDQLFSQEIVGHTDFSRRKWYNCCKEVYCKKHPEAIETCKKSSDDFIDYHEEMKKPKAVLDAIHLERIANNFHKASKGLQEEMLERYGKKLTRKLELLAKKPKGPDSKDDL